MSHNHRKLVTVTRIARLESIQGADRIVLASFTTNSWRAVVKKDEFKVGDYAVFYEIDSALPKEERYSFLEGSANCTVGGESRYRLRSIRLKKTISQGLALPLTAFPEITSPTEGDDVTRLLNVKLYDPAPPVQPGNLRYTKGAALFPHFISKTDQVRVQALQHEDFEQNYVGKKAEVTVKMDGSSMTVYVFRGKFGVCSRNLEVYSSENTSNWLYNAYGKLKVYLSTFVRYWTKQRHFKTKFGFSPSVYRDMAVKYGIEKKLMDYCQTHHRNLAIQGEVCGVGIQNNREKLPDIQFFVFDIFDIDSQKYLQPADRLIIVGELGLQHVPIIDPQYTIPNSIDSLLALADIVPHTERYKALEKNDIEGHVYKLIDAPMRSFKVINNLYLLKYDG